MGETDYPASGADREPVASSTKKSSAPAVEMEAAAAPAASPALGYKDLLHVVLFAVAAFVVAGVACLGFLSGLDYAGWKFDLQQPVVKASTMIAIQVTGWALVVAFIYALVTIKHGMKFGPAVGWMPLARPTRTGLLYSAAGTALACSVAVTASVIPMPSERLPLQQLLQDPAALALMAVFGATVFPAVEELLFRGFFFSFLERMHGMLAAVFATSAFFALIHGPQYGWHWQNLALLFYVGSVLAAVRARTGSIAPAIFMHAGYNATLLLGAMLAGEAMEKA